MKPRQFEHTISPCCPFWVGSSCLRMYPRHFQSIEHNLEVPGSHRQFLLISYGDAVRPASKTNQQSCPECRTCNRDRHLRGRTTSCPQFWQGVRFVGPNGVIHGGKKPPGCP